MNLHTYISQQLYQSYEIKKAIIEDETTMQIIYEVSNKLIEIYRSGHKTLIAGNGGSAADAQHIAAEFVNRFNIDRKGIPSIALTTDSSILTSIANDYGYQYIYSRQLIANAVAGDVFIGISTSGHSENIIEALKVTQEQKIISVGLTGQDGGAMNELCDYCIKVPSNNTPRIQESHIVIGHILCSAVEESLFGSGFEK